MSDSFYSFARDFFGLRGQTVQAPETPRQKWPPADARDPSVPVAYYWVRFKSRKPEIARRKADVWLIEGYLVPAGSPDIRVLSDELKPPA